MEQQERDYRNSRMRILLPAAILAIGLVAGCNDKESAPPPAEKVSDSGDRMDKLGDKFLRDYGIIE